MKPACLPQRGGMADIGHDCHPAQPGNNLAQKFEPLAVGLRLLDR